MRLKYLSILVFQGPGNEKFRGEYDHRMLLKCCENSIQNSIGNLKHFCNKKTINQLNQCNVILSRIEVVFWMQKYFLKRKISNVANILFCILGYFIIRMF